jgi:hypothetical protein
MDFMWFRSLHSDSIDVMTSQLDLRVDFLACNPVIRRGAEGTVMSGSPSPVARVWALQQIGCRVSQSPQPLECSVLADNAHMSVKEYMLERTV